MGWTDLPLSTARDVQEWEPFLVQFYKALRERVAVAGNTLAPDCCRVFPRSNIAWDSGTISGITATSLTDSAKDWQIPPNCSGTSRWVGLSCSNAPWNPSHYDVIIDDCDPRMVVRAQITANTSTTLTITDITDYVTAGWIASVSSLNGRRYYIIKRDGIWWSERWMPWPNDEEHAKGSVSSAMTNSITSTGQKWKTNQFVGNDLLVYANDNGRLKRVSITANTSDTITYATQSWTASGNFIVVSAGGKGFPGRPSGVPFWWYGGATDDYYTHDPADVITSTRLPAPIVKWQEPDGFTGACEDANHQCLDFDCWSAIDEECGAWQKSDKCYSPDLYKTLRGLQLAAEQISGAFLDQITALSFTPAIWFYRAGINPLSGTSGTRDVSGNLPVSLGVPFQPIEVHYAIVDARQQILASGTTTYDGGKLLGSFAESHENRTVLASLGWTRRVPREFRYMHEKSGFIADVVEGGAIDPPQIIDFEEYGCAGAGTWITRGRSESYKATGYAGLVGESGSEIDEFAANDRARFSGDNWNDPGIYGQQTVTAPQPPDLDYYDHLYEGRHPPLTYKARESQKKGIATGGSNRTLIDAAQDWWHEQWYAEGVMRIDSGTATSGSTTSLSDTLKADGGEEGCFWYPGRFATGEPYKGFIVEVNISGTWHKRPITSGSQSATQGTIAWDEPFPASAAGKQYRIREPAGYILNRFKDRKLKLIEPDGVTVHEVIITDSDDTTLWFAPQAFTVAADWKYEIVDPVPGRIWKWNGTEWVDPGATPRPDVVTRYGRMTKGDYITATLFNELFRAIDILRWTGKPVTWTNREDPEVEELNAKVAGGPYCCGDTTDCNEFNCMSCWPGCWNAYRQLIECQWNNTGGNYPCSEDPCGSIDPYEENALPTAYYSGAGGAGCMGGVHAIRRYAYASVTGISNCRPVTVHIYVKGALNALVQTPDAIPPNCTGNCTECTETATCCEVPGCNNWCCNGCSYIFDTNGDGGFLFGAWGEFTSTSVISDTGETKKFRVGNPSLPLPNQSPIPGYPFSGVAINCNDGSSQQGYIIADSKAVLKWDFEYAAAA